MSVFDSSRADSLKGGLWDFRKASGGLGVGGVGLCSSLQSSPVKLMDLQIHDAIFCQLGQITGSVSDLKSSWKESTVITNCPVQSFYQLCGSGVDPTVLGLPSSI